MNRVGLLIEAQSTTEWVEVHTCAPEGTSCSASRGALIYDHVIPKADCASASWLDGAHLGSSEQAVKVRMASACRLQHLHTCQEHAAQHCTTLH